MKLAIVALFLCASSHAFADAALCRSVESVAKTVMTARQNGRSMSDMMESTSKIQGAKIAEMAKSIVKTAYDKPRFTTEEHKQRAIENHGNEWAAQCWKAE